MPGHSSRFSSKLRILFFNDTATTEIYTLSLHDALPIWHCSHRPAWRTTAFRYAYPRSPSRWEEHTSELQSPCNLVCRLLLEKEMMRFEGVFVVTIICTLLHFYYSICDL